MDEKTVYSFGTMTIMGEDCQVVRVKSKEPVELPAGYNTIVEEYPDMIVTHDFKVTGCIAEETDADGNFYKWFTIVEHSRVIDRSPAAVHMAEQNAANLDYVCMMAGIDLPTEDTNTAKEGMSNE